MRPGFILWMIGGGALVLSALIFISPKAKTTSTDESRATIPVEGVSAVEPQAQRASKPMGHAEGRQAPPLANAHGNQASPETQEQDTEAREEKRETGVAARITELRELASKTDPASWMTLLSEVRNPDPEIREAALDIISQSGNRAAIPELIEAAAQTEDTGMKQAITEAIEFLNLPTLTEVLRQADPTNSSRDSAVEAKAVGPKRQ